MQRLFAAAIILLSLSTPAAAATIPKPPPSPGGGVQSCPQRADAMLGLLRAITLLEGELFSTPVWQRRISQMQEGLADLPSPVVARFLAGKLQPLTEDPGNQEHFTSFTAKRSTFYERLLVHSNPVEMTKALLDDATRIENMMAALSAEDRARLRAGQPEPFEQFDAARFRLWEVRQFVSCDGMPAARLR